ncbi:MAG: hypothetical protein QM774_00865 [Gordonia sp. (in: high G+C Gram-positive bacteria)]|uniref:hypothetical protein n=1 Tax=Gordonia sp. (in: high G+C Gram-positive bacteria) TaxID=84139 RepID=UPI0039E2FC1F
MSTTTDTDDAVANSAAERHGMVVLLTVAGLLTGILTASFVMLYLGHVPFPITAVIAGLVNVLLLRLASSYTSSGWRFAPLAAWVIPVVFEMLPVTGSEPLIYSWQLLLLLLLGLALPASDAYRALAARLG